MCAGKKILQTLVWEGGVRGGRGRECRGWEQRCLRLAGLRVGGSGCSVPKPLPGVLQDGWAGSGGAAPRRDVQRGDTASPPTARGFMAEPGVELGSCAEPQPLLSEGNRGAVISKRFLPAFPCSPLSPGHALEKTYPKQGFIWYYSRAMETGALAAGPANRGR